MSPYTRRRALALSVPLALGGCLGRESAVDTRIEGHIPVANYDDESHVVHATIVGGDESVYERALEVPAADGEGENENPGEAVFEEIPTEPGEYVLHARRSDQSEEQQRTLDLREYDFECVEVMVRIGEPFREDLESTLSIWRSFDCSGDE
ncbi:hypothetical protein [Natronobacterium texcoconense]|uniref:Uncharacterized protein n=1 Tax=Natronobacterium texcoconense TaxID=1095778 RepID=A0A1H1A7Z3_NATTX|nr:hypothetical protein [Natronobacterium texcoconense]SDQ35631.1 hypothetical protein SAMN04489842_0595 [Natronobacterium texcoconense]